MNESCIFCKIANREVPANIIFENEEFLAFRDINGQAPVHVLVIPRAHTPNLMEARDSGLLGRALAAVQEVARKEKIHETGFRTVINHLDDGGQTVHHLHFHILGGRFMSWPPG